MPTEPAVDADTDPPARLLIHSQAPASESTSVGHCMQTLERLLMRSLRALVARAPGSSASAPFGMRIDDLQGRQWFAQDEARPLTDVALPAGTYHVSVRRGERRWRYTVTLERGAAFDLHLHLAAEGQ